MLEPRVADLLVLLLLLVAFPLAAYILLGKWSEAARRNERVASLAQQAATEALIAESMTVSTFTPKKGGVHQCARCLAPATTRCAKCKLTRYCSGGCQIVHWRQIHMYECQKIEITSFMSSPTPSLGGEHGLERIIPDEVVRLASSSEKSSLSEKVMPERSGKFNESLRTTPQRVQNGSATFFTGQDSSRNQVDDEQTRVHHGMVDELKSKGSFIRLTKEKHISDTDSSALLDGGMELASKYLALPKKITDKASTKVGVKENGVSKSTGGDMRKPTKSTFIGSSEQSSLVVDKQRDCLEKSKDTGSGKVGFMKIMEPTKSTKLSSSDGSPIEVDKQNKFKMLFPYGEFVRLFHHEDLNLFPRGLLNCGNSCYANAVLQCLFYTKPLIVYLLERLHSRSCCAKSWCLICELERHAMMSRNGGPPLSPSTILSPLRNINCQIGGGSQEDAHEFLRFLVTSMQSICLEGQGGEKKVNIKLQETTFVQHTFGGRLRSKVKCLHCRHESERYENIMDLTLEIYGWVESLEDALTQFTTPEDLDGENMYRCGRCSAYVRARKQLTIHEAPNILTIVLKRFQEGKYGKITKCITFPDFLDMVPFMTGKEDIPPLYLLYAVIVHVDTLNASFSGHYIAYVKDLRGNWFKVDDTEVQSVSLSQVMSEGAYILFYSRSSPRPTKDSSGATMKQPTYESLKHSSCKTQKHSTSGQNTSNSRSQDVSDTFTKIVNPVHHGVLRNAIRNNHPAVETFVHSVKSEFSDAASSEWSIFTSSDDASFTTESTRDSFSIPDSVDRSNNNVISSIFNTRYDPEHYSQNNIVSFRTCTQSKPQTRFAMEMKDYASLEQQLKEGAIREDATLIPASSEAFPCSRNCRYFENYGRIPKDGHSRTCRCEL